MKTDFIQLKHCVAKTLQTFFTIYKDVAISLIKDFGRALARRASDREKLLARAQNLLVPDDRTGVFSSPAECFRTNAL